jgi:acetolactate synthase-1/2/3 large subunit
MKELKSIHGYFDESEYASEKIPMLPQRIVAEIRKALPADAMVTCDAGENRLFMTRFFQNREEGIFLSPASTGGMGYAIPAALACKLLHPERPAVAVCGDGGFAMSMNGLITAREESLPIVVVVLNNNALGWVKHFQGDRVIASEFPDMNVAEIANAMGCKGYRADNPHRLSEAIAEALREDRPAVVDVLTTMDLSYRDILSPLAGP